LIKDLSLLNLFTEEQLQECKQLFFYQYILAGAWRQLRRKRWQSFQEVMSLLNLTELKDLSCPTKFWLFQGIFKALSFVLGH